MVNIKLHGFLPNLPYMRNLPGVPKKTGHCLISCNVKAIKAIAMK